MGGVQLYTCMQDTTRYIYLSNQRLNACLGKNGGRLAKTKGNEPDF